MRALAVSLFALLIAGCTDPSTEATTTMRAPTETSVSAASDGGGARFAPDNVTIQVRDTVTFRVASGRHTVDFNETSGLSNAHSGDIGVQTPFSVRFTQAGTYHYSCVYHTGMTGVVHVEAA